jgi:hypothetical protein
MMDIDKAKEVLSVIPSTICHNSITAVQALASILVAQHEELMNKLDSMSECSDPVKQTPPPMSFDDTQATMINLMHYIEDTIHSITYEDQVFSLMRACGLAHIIVHYLNMKYERYPIDWKCWDNIYKNLYIISKPDHRYIVSVIESDNIRESLTTLKRFF